jgi:hypothetical protein
MVTPELLAHLKIKAAAVSGSNEHRRQQASDNQREVSSRHQYRTLNVSYVENWTAGANDR